MIKGMCKKRVQRDVIELNWTDTV